MTVINNSPSAHKSLGPGRLHVSQSLNDIQGRVFHQERMSNKWSTNCHFNSEKCIGFPRKKPNRLMCRLLTTDGDLSSCSIQKCRYLVVHHPHFQSQVEKVQMLPCTLVNGCTSHHPCFVRLLLL